MCLETVFQGSHRSWEKDDIRVHEQKKPEASFDQLISSDVVTGAISEIGSIPQYRYIGMLEANLFN